MKTMKDESLECRRDEYSAAHRNDKLKSAARSLADLRLPGLRLEKFAGNRAGESSIRINDQFRICFRWSEGDAHDVDITDYH